MPDITLPDGSTRSFDNPVSGLEIAASIGPGLAKAALVISVDGELWDLSRPIETDAAISMVTAKDDAGLEVLRHDTAHLMAEAVKELYPDTQVTIGPAIESGFYYDFARTEPFTPDDLVAIQARMAEILLPFIGVMIVSLIVQFVGYGTMVGLMSDERPTVDGGEVVEGILA